MQAVDSLTGLLIDDFTLVKPEGFTPDSKAQANFQVNSRFQNTLMTFNGLSPGLSTNNVSGLD